MRLTRLASLFTLLALLGVASALAQTGGFSATLTAAQRTATGLDRLTEPERTALNGFIAAEVSLARQGNVRAFAGTFSGRRSAAEKTAAGLDRLTAEELAALDALVAQAIAAGPVQPTVPQKLNPKDVTKTDRLEVHGEVSLAYGWSRHGDYRAGSLYTTIYDPVTGVALGIGIAQSYGDGWWDDCNGPYVGTAVAPVGHRELRHETPRGGWKR